MKNIKKEKPFEEIGKARITDTRELIISKVKKTGKLRLAELAEVKEGDTTRKLFMPGGIEVQNLEYLENIAAGITAALEKLGWYEDTPWEDPEEFDPMEEMEEAAKDSELIEEFHKAADEALEELVKEVVTEVASPSKEILTAADAQEYAEEKGIAEQKKTFEELFDEMVTSGERVPPEMCDKAFKRKLINRDTFLALKLFHKPTVEEKAVTQPIMNAVPPKIVPPTEAIDSSAPEEPEWDDDEDEWDNV